MGKRRGIALLLAALLLGGIPFAAAAAELWGDALLEQEGQTLLLWGNPAELISTGDLEDDLENDLISTGDLEDEDDLDNDPAAEDLVEDGWSYQVAQGEATITGYDRASGSLQIPGEIGGYPVTAIGDGAFSKETYLTDVTVPEGVTSIGAYAFGRCSRLTQVTLPESLTQIGQEAFASCTRLTDITLPAGVETIGVQAFSNCAALQAIHVAEGNAAYQDQDGVLFDGTGATLLAFPGGYQGAYQAPEGTRQVAEYAFAQCAGLIAVSLPEGVETAEAHAFWQCSALTEVNLPDSLTELGSMAFQGCAALTAVTLPEGISAVSNGLFRDCAALAQVTLPTALTVVGDGAFQGCTALTAVTLPETLERVGYNAFSGCTALQGVTLPAGVTSVAAYAFYGCTALEEATLLGSETALGRYAFYGCDALVLSGYRDSTAAAYAQKAELPFHPLDGAGATTLEDCYLAQIGEDCVYDGTEQTPAFLLDDGVRTLTEGVDYTVSYTQNLNPGEGIATLTGMGSYSGTRQVTFAITLAQPEQVTDESTADGVQLTWTAVPGAEGYYLYRRTGGSEAGSSQLLATLSGGNTLTYEDQSADLYTEYLYRVCAYAGETKGQLSEELSVTRSYVAAPPTDEDDDFPPADEDDDFPPADEDDDFPPADEDEDFPPADEDDDFPPADEDEDFPPADEDDDFPPADEDEDFPPADEDDDFPPADEGDDLPPADEDDNLPPADEKDDSSSAEEGATLLTVEKEQASAHGVIHITAARTADGQDLPLWLALMAGAGAAVLPLLARAKKE
jgi:hypothetical protein